jgi:hypothetical protein
MYPYVMCNFSIIFHLIHRPHTRTPKYVQNWLHVIQILPHIPPSMTCVNVCIKRNVLMVMDLYLKGTEKNHEMVLHFLIEDSKSTKCVGPMILLLQLHKNFLQVSSWTSSATLKYPGCTWLNYALTEFPIFEQCPQLQYACEVNLQ